MAGENVARPHLALIILDGLADRPHPETGGVSPVVAAATPNLDRMVRDGRIGRASILGPGVAPESDAGVLALLGYDPEKESPGRGVLEALGVGVPLASGDVAFRLNFATVDGSGVVVDSRVGRNLTTAEAKELAKALTSARLLDSLGISAEVRSTVGHRGVLWLHPTDGRPLSKDVSNSDPFYERRGGMGQARAVERPTVRPVEPLVADWGAVRTAQAVNAFQRGVEPVLAGHTVNAKRALSGKKLANAVLLRSAGAIGEPVVEPFAARQGLEGAAVTEMPVERGIAQLLGLEDRYVGPMGADREGGFRERARVTREALSKSPFVYVHLKGPDEPGHDGRAIAKKEIVEAIDRSFFGPFLDGLDLANSRILVTADHATPCILKAHSDDPVPVLLFGANVTPAPEGSARGVKFGEPAAATGPLGEWRGRDVLKLLRSPSMAPPA